MKKKIKLIYFNIMQIADEIFGKHNISNNTKNPVKNVCIFNVQLLLAFEVKL